MRNMGPRSKKQGGMMQSNMPKMSKGPVKDMPMALISLGAGMDDEMDMDKMIEEMDRIMGMDRKPMRVGR